MFWSRRRPEELEVCPVCRRDMVHPLRWHEAGEAHWWVELRCGECGTQRRGRFPDAAMQRFDRRLDQGRKEISDEADQLHHAWRSAEADAFADALARDLIEAGDFAD